MEKRCVPPTSNASTPLLAFIAVLLMGDNTSTTVRRARTPLLAFIAVVLLGDNTSTTVRRVRTPFLAFIAIVLLGGKEGDEHSCWCS